VRKANDPRSRPETEIPHLLEEGLGRALRLAPVDQYDPGD
jgi:hypothetical protein